MTRKIVINKCYGGFGLSLKGLEYLANLKGKKLYFYKYDYFDNTTIQIESHSEALFDVYATTEDLGNKIKDIDVSELVKFRFSENDYMRTDKDLIKTVEDLGEEANSRISELKIVEIPSDILYTIKDYDGFEWVAEKHRTWS